MKDYLAAIPASPRSVELLVYTPGEFAAMRAEERPFLVHALEGAKRWLRQAENDLAFGEVALRERFFAQACFVAQQTSEKPGRRSVVRTASPVECASRP